MTEKRIYRLELLSCGATTVAAGDDQPVLAIFAASPTDDDESKVGGLHDKNCLAMGEQLASFLNGGARPCWLNDMQRNLYNSLAGVDGSCVIAVGPRPSDNEEETHFAKLRMELIERLTTENLNEKR